MLREKFNYMQVIDHTVQNADSITAGKWIHYRTSYKHAK